MTPEQADLVERVRECVATEASTHEVSMFGGRSFMVNEKMIVSVRKDGSLLVRVSADAHEELLRERGASQAVMGPGRDMGAGWVHVDVSALADDERLEFWIEHAMSHNRGATRRPT